MTDVNPGEVDEAVEAADTETAARPEPVVAEEEFAKLPDGRILLGFEGRRYFLRRPRFGEFRHLRTLFLGFNDIKDADEQIDYAVKWVSETFAALSDKPLDVPTEDWPTWLIMGTQYSEWIDHWRSVPLAHGGSADQ